MGLLSKLLGSTLKAHGFFLKSHFPSQLKPSQNKLNRFSTGKASKYISGTGKAFSTCSTGMALQIHIYCSTVQALQRHIQYWEGCPIQYQEGRPNTYLISEAPEYAFSLSKAFQIHIYCWEGPRIHISIRKVFQIHIQFWKSFSIKYILSIWQALQMKAP